MISSQSKGGAQLESLNPPKPSFRKSFSRADRYEVQVMLSHTSKIEKTAWDEVAVSSGKAAVQKAGKRIFKELTDCSDSALPANSTFSYYVYET